MDITKSFHKCRDCGELLIMKVAGPIADYHCMKCDKVFEYHEYEHVKYCQNCGKEFNHMSCKQRCPTCGWVMEC